MHQKKLSLPRREPARKATGQAPAGESPAPPPSAAPPRKSGLPKLGGARRAVASPAPKSQAPKTSATPARKSKLDALKNARTSNDAAGETRRAPARRNHDAPPSSVRNGTPPLPGCGYMELLEWASEGSIPTPEDLTLAIRIWTGHDPWPSQAEEGPLPGPR